jgi:hypothetical protein
MLIEFKNENLPEIVDNLERVLKIIENNDRNTGIDRLPEHLTIRDIISKITNIDLWDKEYIDKLNKLKKE